MSHIRSFRDGFHYGLYNYNSGVRNQHTTGGGYEFHIHRAYIIGQTSQRLRYSNRVEIKFRALYCLWFRLRFHVFPSTVKYQFNLILFNRKGNCNDQDSR